MMKLELGVTVWRNDFGWVMADVVFGNGNLKPARTENPLATLRYINCSIKLNFDADAVRRFCHEQGIARLELFGSALRDELRDDSDVDLLATIRPGVKCGLFEWVELKEGLERIFGRSVDLVSRRAIDRSTNLYRRNSILARTQPIYVEG